MDSSPPEISLRTVGIQCTGVEVSTENAETQTGCQIKCPYNIHDCGRIHPIGECPPCRHPIGIKQACGHFCTYECHVVLQYAWKIARHNCSGNSLQTETLMILPIRTITPELLTEKPEFPIGVPEAVYQGRNEIYRWIRQLSNPNTRTNSLMQLSAKRDEVCDLAKMLYSVETIACILYEVASIYRPMSTATLNFQQCTTVGNALTLVRCLASYPDTRKIFLNHNFALMLIPILNTSTKTNHFKYLRLSALAVVASLLMDDEWEVTNFLLNTEIIPSCVHVMSLMESSNELSANVAILIVQKILLKEAGLIYICRTYDRFTNLVRSLGKMVIILANETERNFSFNESNVTCCKLLKIIIRCYLRLSDNFRAREALRESFPYKLKDWTFTSILLSDKLTKEWLETLLSNIRDFPYNVAATVYSEGPDLCRPNPRS